MLLGKNKGSKSLGILDDFESGNTDISDIVLGFEKKGGLKESLALLDIKTHLHPTSDDLDFSNISKTTVTPPILQGDDAEEIDCVVRSSNYASWRDMERDVDDFHMHFDVIQDEHADLDFPEFGEDFEDFSFDNMDEDTRGLLEESDAYGNEQRQKILGNSQIPRPQYTYQFPKPSPRQQQPTGFQIHSDFSRPHPTALPTSTSVLTDVTSRDLNSEQHEDSPKRVCRPRTAAKVAKPVLKYRRNTLNLLVDAENGDLDDATKYATEINSQNCEGIPIPERTNELVTIPASGEGRVRKAALIRAILVRNKQSSAIPVDNRPGFYSEGEHEVYLREVDDKENARPKNLRSKPKPRTKKVQWANTLEW